MFETGSSLFLRRMAGTPEYRDRSNRRSPLRRVRICRERRGSCDRRSPLSPLYSGRFNLAIRPFEPTTQVSASVVRSP